MSCDTAPCYTDHNSLPVGIPLASMLEPAASQRDCPMPRQKAWPSAHLGLVESQRLRWRFVRMQIACGSLEQSRPYPARFAGHQSGRHIARSRRCSAGRGRWTGSGRRAGYVQRLDRILVGGRRSFGSSPGVRRTRPCGRCGDPVRAVWGGPAVSKAGKPA